MSGRTSWLDRVNPVTPFLAAVAYSLPLLSTIDLVSALVAFGCSALLLGTARIGPVTVLRRAWPLLLAAPLSGISMLLYARPGGRIWFSFGVGQVSDNSITLAIAISVRVLAIGIPILVVLGTVDPTRLADGLAQVLRLPARFVLGALAGIRLMAVFTDDWTTMAQARRARGLGDTGRFRRWFTMAFALLVLALRRGGSLATAMEARGFGRGTRTWARPSTMGWRDGLLIGLALAASVGAVMVALVVGSFHWPGSLS
ncbi:energy-coupling factor transporter transmembrane component T family protein [Parenemella sanctibonifatiensis]|uniref:ABC transporter n=1 Tax=Parenemella sanctibonifatiensis TaxID=2016505 RepID=A0A255EL76_9ACTN|nr:energy-coupling factor transporter transmembrane component T [Parenemella sanctibonifatiensis]OYN90212.1 ABC transporter [Parenemella sanctibonifatiensis]